MDDLLLTLSHLFNFLQPRRVWWDGDDGGEGDEGDEGDGGEGVGGDGDEGYEAQQPTDHKYNQASGLAKITWCQENYHFHTDVLVVIHLEKERYFGKWIQILSLQSPVCAKSAKFRQNWSDNLYVIRRQQ